MYRALIGPVSNHHLKWWWSDLSIKPPAMLGRVEQAEAGVMTISASYGTMMPVSQTEIKP